MIEQVVIAGLAGGATAALLRVAGVDFPWVKRLLTWAPSGKPYLCPVCLGSWSAFVWSLVLRGPLSSDVACFLASAAIASWIASQLAPAPDDLQLP